MPNMNEIVGRHDILLMTLDTLRYDVAQQLFIEGRTPALGSVLPLGGWEERHSPASFTYAAHQAFFAGFLPTPATPPPLRGGQPRPQPRLFATIFPGSATTTAHTCVFETADIVSGLAGRGYHTVCIGGVGFFDKRTPLGSVLPALFTESHWHPRLGVTHPDSTAHQVALAVSILERLPPTQRLFLFLNISALHHPNHHYLPGATRDTLASHAAALEYVDRQLPPLFAALRRRGTPFCILCSDHGTAYGEDGYHGHRLGHPTVWTVPYAEVML
jgi:hypothetical protein